MPSREQVERTRKLDEDNERKVKTDPWVSLLKKAEEHGFIYYAYGGVAVLIHPEERDRLSNTEYSKITHAITDTMTKGHSVDGQKKLEG